MHDEITVLFSILSTAFLAHYNAPLFFEQLAPGPDGKRGSRFTLVSVLGFSAAGLIMSVVMAGGFLTFGTSSSGLILNNYCASDGLAEFARVAIGLSLITAYPLVFFSLRKLVVGFLGSRGDELSTSRPLLLNVLLLALVTAIALNLHDLGKVATFAGALFGSFLIYIAPAIMALRAKQRRIGPLSTGLGAAIGHTAQLLLVPLGIMLAAVGVYETFR